MTGVWQPEERQGKPGVVVRDRFWQTARPADSGDEPCVDEVPGVGS